MLAGLMSNNAGEQVLNLAKLKLKTSWLLAAAVAIPMIVAAEWILGWFGFSGGGEVLVMLVLAHLLGACSLVFRSVLYAAGKVWVQCWQTLIWGMVLGVSGWCLRGYGAWGLAVAYLLAFAVHIIFQGLAAGRWLQPEQVIEESASESKSA